MALENDKTKRIDEKIRALEEERRKLAAAKRSEQARIRERERKMRNHAMVTFGAMVAAESGLDWTEIDAERLRRYLKRWGRQIAKQCAAEALPAAEAAERLRSWERGDAGAFKVAAQPAEPEPEERPAVAEPAEPEPEERPAVAYIAEDGTLEWQCPDCGTARYADVDEREWRAWPDVNEDYCQSCGATFQIDLRAAKAGL